MSKWKNLLNTIQDLDLLWNNSKSDVGLNDNDNNEVVKVGTFQVPNVKQMAEAIVLQAIENGLEVKELKALNAEIANQIKALA